MKRLSRLVIIALVVTLTGCASTSRRPNVERANYYDHVSDVETDPEIKGYTYDEGPSHPTFWESVFERFGIE